MENKKKTNFTQISNICIYDKNLSLDARGLMSILISYPNDWQFYNENISKIANVGIDKLNRLYKQLEIYGYLKRTKKRDNKGKFRGFEFKICDKGSFKMIMSAEFITEKTPSLQKSALDISVMVKSAATNTHLTKTKYKFKNIKTNL